MWLYRYQSEVFGNDANDLLSEIDDYGTWNARASLLGLFDNALDISAWITNGSDEENPIFNQVQQELLGFGYSYYNPPRMYGLELTYAFGR